MNVVFLGATRGIGRALARAMSGRGDQLYLLGRDDEALQATADDLAARGGKAVGHGLLDLAGDAAAIPGALDDAQGALGDYDTVVVTAAIFHEQEELEQDADLCDRLLTVNFTNTINFCEEARRRLLARGGGTLCVFSSVAGERARKPRVLYGATKAGLTHYLEGLDHRYRRHGLKTVTVVPGIVRTDMIAGAPERPFTADPEQIVPAILRAIDRGKPRIFVPPIWRLVMMVIRNLPRFVMRRVEF